MLYDQFGRPVAQRKLPERRPLAAAPILDTWREYVAAGLTPRRLAAIFKEADAGDLGRQAELFDQMEEKDGHLVGEKGKRQNAILDVEFKVSPATDDKRDAQVAEFVEEYLGDLTDFEDVLVALQDGVGKGFAALEIGWDVSAGQAVPDRFDFIEQKRFRFCDEKGFLRRTPLLLTDEDGQGIEIPPWQAMVHIYGGKSGYPTRSGIYRVCAWMYLFKNYAVKDWAAFCEVYGMPLRLGKYEPGASQADKEALMTAVTTLGSDAAGIISKSTEIEFVETVKNAGADLYEKLAAFSNKEISKAILGQTLTAEVGERGSYAASKTHNEVRLDLAKADTRSAAATIRYQLIRPVVGFNFGWETPVPHYGPVWEEAENLKEKADWVTALLDRGVRMPVSFINREFNIPEPEKDEAVVSGGLRNQALPAKRRIAGRYRVAKGNNETASEDDLVDLLVDRLLDEAPVDSLVDAVAGLVERAQSLEEIRDGIIDLYPEMDTLALGTLIQQALTLADLSGRFDVSEGE